MSALIGDYVHLRYERFLKYGTTLKEEQANALGVALTNFNHRVIDNLKLANNNKLTLKDFSNIESRLNWFYGSKTKLNQGDENKEKEEALQNFLKNIATALEKETADITTTLALKTRGQLDEELRQSISELKKITGESYATIAVIQKHLQLFNDAWEQLQTNLPDNIEELKQQLDFVNKEWEQIFNYRTEGSVKIYAPGRVPDLHSALNDLRDKILQITYKDKKLQGTFAESVAALALYQIEEDANNVIIQEAEKIQDILEEAVIGGNEASNVFNAALFVNDLDTEIVMKGTSYKEIKAGTSAGLFYGKAVQGKVDITVSIDDKPILGSVKNYNMSLRKKGLDSIHLLNGTSIITLLQEFPDYVNNYLNIVTEHKGEPGPPRNIIDLAHESAKNTILMRALMGGQKKYDENSGTVFEEKQANLFIIVDNSGGGFKIYDMNTILYRVLRNMDSLKIEGYDKIFPLKNDEATNYSARISNIIAQLHHAKISVSIKKDIFSEFYT